MSNPNSSNYPHSSYRLSHKTVWNDLLTVKSSPGIRHYAALPSWTLYLRCRESCAYDIRAHVFVSLNSVHHPYFRTMTLVVLGRRAAFTDYVFGAFGVFFSIMFT
ncbi:hypothetical protein HGRIS_001762 [Hohenbuehelia grisea]|uniref:Uncharacterized protein n=1 Tax=Hohenbuehelia grisea TaxID=104357 RepID=A0ABR3JIT0_9AGAR